MANLEGERFGRYLLLETIGKGGMAEIFRAVSHGVEGFQRVFVVKRILKEKSASKEFIDMFLNEARISALLHHPNIVQTYELGQIDGSYFMAMEYLRGKDLLSVLRELRKRQAVFAPEVAAYVAQQVAAGLGYAHSLSQHGGKSLDIVHRDVSPSNVMLLRAGGVKLLDFGIAKAAAEVRNTGDTQVGLIKGKLSYLSPEQVKGDPIDARSDVFSLGVVLWECLTGKRLFYDKSDYQTMKNVSERPVPPPSMQRPNVPAALDYIVIRALERDLNQRYPSAKQMADDLDNYLKEVRFSATAMPRFLDELFGEDDGEIVQDDRLPGAALEPDSRLHLSRGDDAASRSLSDNVPPTTVARSAIENVVGLAKKNRRVAIGAGAAVALAVVLPFVFGGKAEAPKSQQAAIATSEASVAPAPVGIAVGETPAPVSKGIPSTVDIVSVRLDSDPQGAEVSGEDFAPLGKTPITLALPRGVAPVSLVLKKEGYEGLKHAIVPDRNVSAMVTLRALPAPAPTPVRAPVRPAPVRKAKGKPAAERPEAGKVRDGVSLDPFGGNK